MLLFLMKPTYIQVLIKKDALSLNKQFFLFTSRGSVLYFFDVLHVQIFIQQTIMGAMKF